jgi:hypothetical protein
MGSSGTRPGPARSVVVVPVVTIAALYGASGRIIGPRVAERLGVSFLDRGVLAGVAKEMQVPEEAAAEVDASSPKERQSAVRRYFEDLGRNATSADGSPLSDRQLWESRYRSATDRFLARAAVAGGLVLGRGGAVVLRAAPGVLHVRLGGPAEARIRAAMWRDGIDERTARRRLETNDRARKMYVRRAYGVDPDDPHLYHLWIDSTALDLDTCVELILTAARSRAAWPGGEASPTGSAPGGPG